MQSWLGYSYTASYYAPVTSSSSASGLYHLNVNILIVLWQVLTWTVSKLRDEMMKHFCLTELFQEHRLWIPRKLSTAT